MCHVIATWNLPEPPVPRPKDSLITSTMALAVPSESRAPLILFVIVIVSPRSPARYAANPAAADAAVCVGIEAATVSGTLVLAPPPLIVGVVILGTATEGTVTAGAAIDGADCVGTLMLGAVIFETFGKNGIEL